VIDVVRDTEGIRLAALQILEEGFQRGRVERTALQATEETRARLVASVARPTMAAGYLRWCDHLWGLESQREIGLSLDGITSYEMLGLISIAQGRREFEGKHPECSACKMRQPSRFQAQCDGCGAKFRRKK
jgi:hypothetical protein